MFNLLNGKLSRNKEVEHKIRKLFLERKIIKQYLAITKLRPKDNEGEINIPLIEREVNQITKVNFKIWDFFLIKIFYFSFYFQDLSITSI